MVVNWAVKAVASINWEIGSRIGAPVQGSDEPSLIHISYELIGALMKVRAFRKAPVHITWPNDIINNTDPSQGYQLISPQSASQCPCIRVYLNQNDKSDLLLFISTT